MLRRMGPGPVARQAYDEDHRTSKCIGEPETMPYPEREDGTRSGNQESRSLRRRIGVTAEESGLHSRAEKANRANGESLLDPVPIEPGLGNGEFGACI